MTQAEEFQVPTNGMQDQERPQAVQLALGSWVAVWEDESSGHSEVYLRLFNTNGTPLIAPARVHPATTNDQSHPVVTGLSNGTFVVAWSARNLDGSSYGVAFRRFNAAGVALDASPVQANVTTDGPQFRPQLAMLLGGGSFVLAFVGQSSQGNQDIFFRRFNVNGAAFEATDMPVNTLGVGARAAGDQGSPAVAAVGGGFVVAYEDRVSADVYAARFQFNGLPAEAPGGVPGVYQYLVHQNLDFRQSEPAVAALTNGGYVVAFTSETNGTPESRRVLTRAFTAAGPVSPEFIVGAGMTEQNQSSHVAGLPHGDFAVGWQARAVFGDGSSDFSVWVQRFSPAGSPRIGPFQVNEYETNQQARICLVPFSTSGYGAVWESFGQDGSRNGVFGRLFPPNMELEGRLFIKSIGAPGSRQFKVNFVGQADRLHELQSTSANNLAGWTTILSTNPPTGTFEYLENGLAVDRRFFRVRTP